MFDNRVSCYPLHMNIEKHAPICKCSCRRILYRQNSLPILHLFTGSGFDDGEELSGSVYPVGPSPDQVETGGRRRNVRALVSNGEIKARVDNDAVSFELPQLSSHEVVIN